MTLLCWLPCEANGFVIQRQSFSARKNNDLRADSRHETHFLPILLAAPLSLISLPSCKQYRQLRSTMVKVLCIRIRLEPLGESSLH